MICPMTSINALRLKALLSRDFERPHTALSLRLLDWLLAEPEPRLVPLLPPASVHLSELSAAWWQEVWERMPYNTRHSLVLGLMMTSSAPLTRQLTQNRLLSADLPPQWRR